MLAQAASGSHQGSFLLLRKTSDSGGGENAVAFPTERKECNPGGATAIHLEKADKGFTVTLKQNNMQFVRKTSSSGGGENAVTFPIKRQERIPGGATANHLERNGR